MKKPTVIDLFCGCGGISEGFKQAGFDIRLGVDNWDAIKETWEYNFPNSKLIIKDIRDLSSDEIAREACIDKKEIDVIVGGPPCQGFSLSGKRIIDDPRNMLVKEFIRVVEELQPKFFVMENVLGMLSLAEGKISKEVVSAFKKTGYNVSFKVLNSAEYGVPQVRKRVFYLGNRIGKPVIFPRPTHLYLNSHNGERYTQLSKFLRVASLKPVVTVGDAISDLPLLEDEKGEEVMDYPGPPKTEYQRERRKGSDKLFNHVASNHTELTKKIIALVPEGGNWTDLPEKYQNIRSFSNTWRRLDSKLPSVTIDTGHRHHFHYKANRVPTVRESARIQSFDDKFRFFGPRTHQFRMVGNAVPPLLARAIALEIKKLL